MYRKMIPFHLSQVLEVYEKCRRIIYLYIYKRNGSVTLAIHLSYAQSYVVPIFNFNFFPLKNSENT